MKHLKPKVLLNLHVCKHDFGPPKMIRQFNMIHMYMMYMTIHVHVSV